MAGKFGKHLRERLTGIRARGDRDQFRMRMVQQQLHQNFAGITGRTDDGDFFRFHLQKILTAKYTNHTKNSFDTNCTNFH